ncbi:holliday junction ATP-dependent DNA helicase RuvA [Coprobacillus sp. CAG:826]|jgi:Holliday junction DNA helicase RuvA|nr:holliday junction ATP-dependent DNA helicase RuvA [Coprobacillus sp. CAG:826]
MYYSMHGIVEEVLYDRIVLVVHDIGYEIFVSHIEQYNPQEECTIYLHEVIREDDHFLVGFKDKEERAVFMSLINVKGIGPKTAIGALSTTDPKTFILAIENSDIKFLKKLPGIGPKAAQQILLDLRGHLALQNEEEKGSKKVLTEEEKDTIEALKSLGFKMGDIEKTLAKIDKDGLSSARLTKEALLLLRK